VPVQPFSEKLRQANEIALAMGEATQDDCDAIDAAVGELLRSVLAFDDDVAQQIERMLLEQIDLRLRQEREAAEYRQWFESLSTEPPPQGGQSAPTGVTPIFDSLSQQQSG
jgi:hypothetical protein